jgi:response regulator RpfG family c-di-GMP phosphodiesterase
VTAAPPRAADTAAGTSGQPRPGEEVSPVNILLVDDRDENLIALKAILEPLHLNLVPVRSGKRRFGNCSGVTSRSSCSTSRCRG